MSGRLEHERRKYQKSWEDYYLKRTKLENEGMLLQKVEQKLVAKANIDEGVMFLEHQEEAKDGEQAVLASDLEVTSVFNDMLGILSDLCTRAGRGEDSARFRVAEFSFPTCLSMWKCTCQGAAYG